MKSSDNRPGFLELREVRQAGIHVLSIVHRLIDNLTNMTLVFVRQSLRAVRTLPLSTRVAARSGLLDVATFLQHLTSVARDSLEGDDHVEGVYAFFAVLYSCTHPFPLADLNNLGSSFGATLRQLVLMARRIHSIQLFNLDTLPLFRLTGVEHFIKSPALAAMVAATQTNTLPRLAENADENADVKVIDILGWSMEAVSESQKDIIAFASERCPAAVAPLTEAESLWRANDMRFRAKALVNLRLGLCAALSARHKSPELVSAIRAEFHRVGMLLWTDTTNRLVSKPYLAKAMCSIFSPLLANATAAASSLDWALDSNPELRKVMVETLVLLNTSLKDETLSPSLRTNIMQIIYSVSQLNPLFLEPV